MPKKILYLGNKLHKKGANATTIDTLSHKLVSLGYNVITYSDKSNKLFRLVDMLMAILKHKSIDYILIDTYSTSAFWFAYLSAILSKLLNIKYIPILHGGHLQKRLNNNPKLCKQLFSNAYINISPSSYMLETFKSYGFKNLKCIPNSINLADYTFKERKNIQPRLLWVRAFAEIYNPMMAIIVFERLLKKYPNAALSMVGPEKDKSFQTCLNYVKRKNLSVQFTGKLSNKDWLGYSNNFDVFINTTTVDNTPVSVIEAMALGLPIVSTNAGGMPYLVENKINGILVNSQDDASMFKAIVELIENPEQTLNLSKNARKKAEQFDWNKIKHDWVEIFNPIFASRGKN